MNETVVPVIPSPRAAVTHAAFDFTTSSQDLRTDALTRARHRQAVFTTVAVCIGAIAALMLGVALGVLL